MNPWNLRRAHETYGPGLASTRKSWIGCTWFSEYARSGAHHAGETP